MQKQNNNKMIKNNKLTQKFYGPIFNGLLNNSNMVQKKYMVLMTLFLVSIFSVAQSLNETMRMVENERFESAKISFKRLVATEPNNGNIYYYYGETYFNQSLGIKDTVFAKILKDSANIMYKRGSEVDPSNPLNFIGLGKVLWYNYYPNLAEALFKQAMDMTKNKNATVFIKIADTYINGNYKNIKTANDLLTKALKLEPKNPEVHMLMGDALLEASGQMDASGPVRKYNEAFSLDTNNAKPILRIGKIYFRSKNPNEALVWYKKAIKIDSTYAPSYLEMGELYIMASMNKKALESYKKYLALTNDLEARDRFSQVLWLNKLYEEAVNEISAIQKTDSSSYTLYRLLGYSYMEVGDKFPPDGYKKGLTAIRKFFDMTANKPNFKYLSTDYSALGKLLSKTGQDSLGIVELKRALALDTSKKSLYSDIAFAYYKTKKYNDAILNYNQKINAGIGTLNDYTYIGLCYFLSKQYALADSAFKIALSASPDYILAYKYRAKSNVQLDPESKLWLAKPFYKREMELLLAKPELLEKPANKKDLIEAYEYLGAYYFLNAKDIVKASEYFSKILALDTANKKAKDYFKTPDAKNPNPNISLAKPFYDKIVETVLAKPENLDNAFMKGDLIEAYEYLANYNLTVAKDLLKAKEYFNKLKELDTNNMKANDFFNSPEGKG
jgi:tetratricopeptide (TPR) repeat protein